MTNVLGLDAAVEEIADTFVQFAESGKTASSAFFWLVGAGVSAPEVPLAGEIERRCQEVLRERGKRVRLDAPEVPEQPSARYAHWLGRAYSQPSQRRDFLHSMITGRSISAATLRLAHLLSAPLPPHLVVTTNFDDFLTEALRLFNQPYGFADHPGTAERINPENGDDVQVFQVHGTYEHYDCCNLPGEITNRAEKLAPRLDLILERRSPLVLGYSGWEDDVFMQALRRRLATGRAIASNVYWFCHRREEVEALPAFLREREDVRLVVPAGTPAEETLDAAAVLRRMIQRLRIPPPAFTSNPIAVASERLSRALPASDARDVYDLRSIVRNLDVMAAAWDPPAGEMTARIEELERLLHGDAYAEALVVAEGLLKEEQELDEDALDKLLQVGYLIAEGLSGTDGVGRAFDVTVHAAEAIERRGLLLFDHPLAVDIGVALVWKGRALAKQGETDAAIEAFEETVDRYADDPDPEICEQAVNAALERAELLIERDGDGPAADAFAAVASRFADNEDLAGLAAPALVQQGSLLLRLGRDADAIEVFREARERLRAPSAVMLDDPEWELAMTLVGTGWALHRLDHHDLAVRILDTTIKRYDEHSRYDKLVSLALVFKTWSLVELGDDERVLAVSEELVDRYGDEQDIVLRRHVAFALRDKLMALWRLSREEEALAACDELATRREVADLDVRFSVLIGLLAQAQIRNQLDRPRAAVEVCDALLALVDDELAPEQDFAPWVAAALVERGTALAALAQRDQTEDAPALRAEALAAYDEVVDRFGATPGHPDVRRSVAIALLARGDQLAAMGRRAEAIAAYARTTTWVEGDESLARFEAAARRAGDELREESTMNEEDLKKGIDAV